MSVKETINSVFAKLPFKALAEKIPESTQAKAPVLKKAIPFANQIVCGLAVVIVVVAVACSGGGDGGGNIRKLVEERAALRAQKEKIEENDTAGIEKVDAQIAKISEQLNTAWAAASAKGASYSGEHELLNKPEQFEYELTEDGAGVRIEDTLPETKNIPIIINVPTEIEGYPVVEIGANALMSNRITSVTLPNSVTKLGRWAIYDTRIASITLPPGLIEIGDLCFRSSNITSITIPASVTTIRQAAFLECDNLTEVTILEGITTIEQNTFAGCAKLTTVTIPESVTTILEAAFNDCPELTTVNLPSHPIKYLDFNGNEMHEDILQGASDGCPKLSLAARKAIQDTGYTGEF